MLWNIGGTLGMPWSTPTIEPAASPINVDADAWFSEQMLIDIDGDGRSDDVIAGDGSYRSDPRDGTRRGLMRRVDNGRGLVTEIRYNPHSDGGAVAMAEGLLPRPIWVVSSVRHEHAHGGAPDSESQHSYRGPVWNQDDDQVYGFRGFSSTRAVGAAGSVEVTEFDYSLDWRGRDVSTAVFVDAAAESGARPHRLREVQWAEYGLFGGAVSTHHPTEETIWTCADGQSASECRSAGAVRRHLFEWEPLAPNLAAEPVLYVQGVKWRIDQLGSADDDDLRDRTSYLLYYDEDTYRLRLGTEERLAFDSASASWEQPIARTEHEYDSDGRFETETCAFRSDTVAACTRRARDDVGNIVEITKPEQVADGATVHTSFDYDADGLFVTRTTNELGHEVTTTTDRGTGVVTRSRGPNVKDCGFLCSAREEQRIVIDGWGRAVERWITIDDEIDGYRLVQVGRTAYDDNPSPGVPESVTDERLIAFDDGYYTATQTLRDGAGRVIEVRQRLAKSGALIAVTEYHHDAAGNVVAVDAADPSATYATSTELVTHFFTFDPLGRATGNRRPDGTGEALHYDGLTTTRAECVPEITGDPTSPCLESSPTQVLAATEVENDVFGRIVRVAERLDDDSWATTVYDHDGNSEVVSITNPDGVITGLTRDWSGNAIAITRASRTWGYTYDLNDNLIAIVAPAPTADTTNYTTLVAYDDLDRVTSRDPAPLGLSATERRELGIGFTLYDYDTGDNGLGRLASARVVSTKATDILRTDYSRDAQGLPIVERRAFDLASMGHPHGDVRETRRSFNALGEVAESWHPDGQPGSSTSSHAFRDYDARGLAAALGLDGQKLARNHRNPSGRVYRRDVGLTARTVAFDKLGRIVGDSVVDGGGQLQVEQVFTYGATDEVVGRTSFVNGSGDPRTMFLDYDSRHQIVAASDDQDYEATFSYTPGGRIASAAVDASPSAFDVHRRDVSYDYTLSPDLEAVDQLIGANGELVAGYAYDLAGNAVSRVTDDGSFAFVYDGEQRLRRVAAPGDTAETYLYDHTGTRVVAISAAGGAVDRVRFWSGATEVWFDSGGGQQKALLHLGMGTPIARLGNQSDLEIVVHSAAGHLLAALDDTGQVTTGYHYGPFGELLAGTGETADHTRRFNGKEHDAIAGLTYYGARYFDPLSLGWTQADPLYRFSPEMALDEPRRMNLYVFTLNNPMRLVDPDGLSPDDVIDNYHVPTAAENAGVYALFLKAVNSGTLADRRAAVRAIMETFNLRPSEIDADDIRIVPLGDGVAGTLQYRLFSPNVMSINSGLFAAVDPTRLDYQYAFLVSTLVHETVHAEQLFQRTLNGSVALYDELQAYSIELLAIRLLHAAGRMSDDEYKEIRDDIFEQIDDILAKARRMPKFRNPVLGSIINRKRSTRYYQGLWGVIPNPEFAGNIQ